LIYFSDHPDRGNAQDCGKVMCFDFVADQIKKRPSLAALFMRAASLRA
jgi:hypothetical protein